jgi:hypothetical protein
MMFAVATTIIALTATTSMTTTTAFTPAVVVFGGGVKSSSTSTSTSKLFSSGMDLSGNSWKPDSEKMGSTDTGDYFPEGTILVCGVCGLRFDVRDLRLCHANDMMRLAQKYPKCSGFAYALRSFMFLKLVLPLINLIFCLLFP